MKIDITCKACGAAFRVAEKYAGKRVKCSFCDKRITVPNVAKGVATQACPKCESKMAAGSVICIECGYDLRSRKKVMDQHRPTNDRPARARNQQAFLILVGVAGGVVLLCIGLYAFIKSESKKREEMYAEQARQGHIQEQTRSNAKAALENNATLKEAHYNLTCKKRFLELARQKIKNSSVWTIYFAQSGAKAVHFKITLTRTIFKSYSFRWTNSYAPGKVTLTLKVSYQGKPASFTDDTISAGLPSMVFVRKDESAQGKAFAIAEKKAVDQLPDVLDRSGVKYFREQGVFESKFLPVILHKLKSGTPESRAIRARALGIIKADTPEVIDSLTQALNSGNSDLAQAAVLSLGQLGNKSLVALPAMIKLMGIPKEKTRVATFEALRKLRCYTPEVLVATVPALKTASKKTSLAALAWLRSGGRTIAPILPDLVFLLRHKDKTVRRKAKDLYLLGRKSLASCQTKLVAQMKSDSSAEFVNIAIDLLQAGKLYNQETVGVVSTFISHADKRVRSGAANFLANAAGIVPKAREILVANLKSTDPKVKMAAAKSLGRRQYGGKHTTTVLPLFEALVATNNPALRKQLSRSIHGGNPPNTKELPRIIAYANHKDPVIRIAVLQTLAKIRKPIPANVARAIQQGCADSEADVIKAALVALRRKRSLTKEDLLAVGNTLRSKDRNIIYPALKLLRGSPKNAAVTLPQIQQCLRNQTDKRLQADCLMTIGAIGNAAATLVPQIIPYLSRTKLKTSAAKALAGIGQSASIALPQLIENLDDKNTVYNRNVKYALIAFGEKAALPLSKLLTSPKVEHRRFAAHTLINMRANAKPAKAALEAARADSDKQVRIAAKGALINIARAR